LHGYVSSISRRPLFISQIFLPFAVLLLRFRDHLNAEIGISLLTFLLPSHKPPLDISFLFSCFTNSSIFSTVLLLRFRDHLKAEIGIFFPLIVLRSLDLGDSPLHQRVAVLKSLQTTFADPQTVLDFFVNYDCDLDSTNLFERAVKSLSRIAQGVPGSDPGSLALAQNTGLKASSLHVLVNILQSLLVWTRKGQAASIAVISVAANDAEKQDGEVLGRSLVR
jgi:hypothetical protein